MSFWRPGEVHPDDTREESSLLPYLDCNEGSIVLHRQRLPIFQHRSSILYALEQNGVVLIAAETGSGKSTRESKLLTIVSERSP